MKIADTAKAEWVLMGNGCSSVLHGIRLTVYQEASGTFTGLAFSEEISTGYPSREMAAQALVKALPDYLRQVADDIRKKL